MTDLHNASFWDSNATNVKIDRGSFFVFTSKYAECAWKQAALPRGAKVLDIAAGFGPLTLIAAADGAQVLSTDFSPGMVATVAAHGLPNVEARVMDGQALDLADGSYDAAFSMFGIMLFADWQKGLSEMARVLRSDGIGCISTWACAAGAASNLLIAEIVSALYPTVVIPYPVEGMNELLHPDRLQAAMQTAGFTDIAIQRVCFDFMLDESMCAEPEKDFQFSPLWKVLDVEQKAAVLERIRRSVTESVGALPIPSPALIATGRKT